MPVGKGEIVFLERVPPSGVRKWQRARLFLDPIAGRLTLRYRDGLRKKETLEWQVNQIETLSVEMHPNPHSRIYESAILILLMLLLTNLISRFNLEDTFFEVLVEMLPILLGAVLAAGISRLIKVPVIQIKVPDTAHLPEKQYSIYGPLQQAIRQHLQRETDKQGKAITEAELDTMMTAVEEKVPEPVQETLHKVRGVITTFDPGTFRLHGARWGSINKTQALARRLEQILIDHRVAGKMSGRWHDLPWQRSQLISTLSRLVALLIVLGVLGYTLWIGYSTSWR